MPYLPREHTGTKFIYIVRPNNEEILVIGDKRANLHVKLWDCYEESHRDSKESEILGAGELENGRIINWFSKWFHLTTPEELRPHIQKLLELPQST